MRPATVHAGAQVVRHTRGVLTTLEKWLAATPPEAVHEEAGALLWILRGALTDMMTTLGAPRPPAAPPPASPITSDRPAAPAAARPPHDRAGEGHVLRSDPDVLSTR